jgi:hypothetical protein
MERLTFFPLLQLVQGFTSLASNVWNDSWNFTSNYGLLDISRAKYSLPVVPTIPLIKLNKFLIKSFLIFFYFNYVIYKSKLIPNADPPQKFAGNIIIVELSNILIPPKRSSEALQWVNQGVEPKALVAVQP